MSERLQTLTESLAAASTQDDVFGVVLTPALEALEAVAGAVLLVGGGGARLEMAATQGYQEGAQTIWQDGPLDGNIPAGDALERRGALFFEQEGELVRAYPELEARTGGVAAVAPAVGPMFLQDQPLGAIVLDFEEPHDFTPEEKRFLRTLAGQCALALGRVQLTRQLEQRVEERTQEVEAERNFLRALLGSLGESIVACDAGGRLTLFNGVARELHGLDAEPVPPEDWAEHYGLYHADGVTPLAEAQVPLYRSWQGERLENTEMVVRHANGEARTVLVNGQPILGAGGKRLGAVVAQRDITERQRQQRELAAASSRAEVLAALGDALQQATTPEQVAELALDRIGPAVGARSMLVVGLAGEALSLPSVWGEVPQVITAYLNQPGLTLSDAPTFQNIAQMGGALYLDDYRPQDEAIPNFPAQAVGVEPIRTPDGTLGGFLIAGRPTRAGVWQEGERDLLRRAAGTLGLALERAETAAQLVARTRQIEEEARAQEAFVAFTEAVGTETEVAGLATRAVDVLQAQFPEGIGGYYEREGDLWKLRTWTRNLDAQPEFIAALRAGLSGDTPFIADLLRERVPIFTENWDAEHERIEDSEDYGTVAAYPVILGGEVQGFFTMGFKNTSRWAKRDRAIFRAVGHSLTLALERAEQAGRLELQNAELSARTRALEGFAHLTRDLSTETDHYMLIRRAQEVALSLLPEGYALYFEPEGNRWVLRGQTGELRSEALQAVADAGLPYHEAGNLLIPYHSLEPYYQDQYAQDTDNISELVAHLGASATLPVLVNGSPRGVFAVVLFGQLRPWSSAERAMMQTVVRSLGLALERAKGVRELEEEREALAAFARFTEASTHTTDALTLAEGAKDVLHTTLGVEVGYSELEGGLWKGRVFSESTPPVVVRQARQGFPAELPSFALPFEEGDVVFVDGWDALVEGAEHTEVYGAAALYPYFEEGKPHGLLTMGSPEARAWTERERTVFRSVGRSLALAFERAEQARHLQARRNEERRRAQALQAFADLSRDLVLETDFIVLIRRTQEIVLSLLPAGFSVYCEPREGLWRIRSQVGHANTPELQAALDAGLPFEAAANLLTPWRSGEPHYQDEYNPDLDHLTGSDEYPGASVTIPIVVGGQTRGILGFALYTVRHWSGEDRAVLETVGRQLTLALERAEQSRRLADQNAELDARTRALEAFQEWSRDLTLDAEPGALIERAEELLLDLLPVQAALYYERDGERWYVQSMRGEYGSDGLRLAHEAGLLHDTTDNLRIPSLTGETYYQDVYDHVTDGLADQMGHVSATAIVPLRTGRGIRGLIGLGRFGQANWTGPERVTIETVRRSLELALDRAESVALLAQRTRELERSNEELEQFAYIASHDLQAPIRAVTSFAGLIDRRYGPQLDDRGRVYLRQIMEGGEHMKRLVDDLLAFSRVHTERRPLLPVDSGAVFDVVAKRLQVQEQTPGASLTRTELPVVLADTQQLDQLLQNLISNGLKYRREGVTPQVHVSAERDGSMWRFTVSDNGIGIEPHYFERIFVIFQRLHGRGEYEGTGIGLAVCKKIVERHGGRLWLDSTPGIGSTFFFTLPEG